jgi:hypothetical protein
MEANIRRELGAARLEDLLREATERARVRRRTTLRRPAPRLGHEER